MEYALVIIAFFAAAALISVVTLIIQAGLKVSRKKLKPPEKTEQKHVLPCHNTFEGIYSAFFALLSMVENQLPSKPGEDREIKIRFATGKDDNIQAYCLYKRIGTPVADIVRENLQFSGLQHGRMIITDGKGWYSENSLKDNIQYVCENVTDFYRFFVQNHNSVELVERGVIDLLQDRLPGWKMEECDLKVDTTEPYMTFKFEAR